MFYSFYSKIVDKKYCGQHCARVQIFYTFQGATGQEKGHSITDVLGHGVVATLATDIRDHVLAGEIEGKDHLVIHLESRGWCDLDNNTRLIPCDGNFWNFIDY